MQNLKEAKKRFLAKYNPEQSLDVALARAINASVQRNQYLDKEDKTNIKKIKEIREQWKRILKEITHFHCEPKSDKVYEKSIEMVKETVNLVSPKSQIKISHAQKSLSVFLKHLWCFDEDKIRATCFLRVYPVHCPVDAIILRRIKWNGKPWTSVDSIQTHREMIEEIKKYIKKTGQAHTLKNWELLTFSQ